MHISKKILSIAASGFLLAGAIMGGNINQASAASFLSPSVQIAAWQQFYSSVYSKITNQNKKIIPTPNPKPVLNPTPVPAPAPTTPTPPISTPAPTPVASAPAPSVSGKLWGAYLSDGNVSAFQSLTGKTMDMQAIFLGWSDSFPSNSDKTKTLVIFWEPSGLSLSAIAAGNYDSTITQFAAQAKSYGGSVILIPGEEMNGNWDTWDGAYGSNTPAQVVAEYKHIHNVFALAGALNVKFGWDVNNDSVPDTSANSIANYWPGSAYVDYVCVDGFNFGNPWQSYSDVFSSPLSQVRGYGKPIIIASMASAEGPQKAAWITDALNQIAKDSSIAGFVWFNENKEQDWLVNSDSSSLQAFKSAIQQYR